MRLRGRPNVTPIPLQVWRVLTDYERLAEFVPNLERCERLPKGPNGRVILRQVLFRRRHNRG